MALIGQVLDGRYQIEDVLGQGGMGMVFRATQTSVHRPVAVKTLNPSLAAAPQFFERFRREAETASRLRHPNVITIYDFGRSQDGTCYYVMELLEGESLRELVKREGPMTLRRALDVIEQASRGLAHAHEQGAIHRDIKPHNIMVQQLDGRDFVKVLDFGLVKALEQEEEMQLTSTGQVLGTPQYMPPEQAGGDHVDHRSDLYSMAGVLYYCLTGTSPFGANTVRKALTAALTQTPPKVAAKRQGAPIPPALEDFLQKALAREKEDRHQSASEFLDAMQDAVADASDQELDAVPANSVPEAGGGSKPSQRSVSRPGRSSPSAVRNRPASAAGAARGSTPSPAAARSGGSQPSGVRPTGARPAQGSGASRPGSASASGVRQRTPRPAPAPAMVAPPEELVEEPRGGGSGKKIALIAVPLVLFAAGGALVALRPSHPEATPPARVEMKARPAAPVPASTTAAPAPAPTAAAPATDELLLHIHSTPPGAAVFIGDMQIGTTPTVRRQNRNEPVELSFRMTTYQGATRKLDFKGSASSEETVNVTLSPVVKPAAEPTPRPARPASRPTKDKDDSITIFE